MKDIAEATGYSINTVSRALRGDRKLSETSRNTIRQKANEMGYIYNSIASSLRSRHSRIIGVVSADSSNPFFADVVRGIESVVRSYGYHMILVNTEEKAEEELADVKLFSSRNVDGLLIVPVDLNEATLQFYKNLEIPYFFVGRGIQGIDDHSIVHDDFDAQYRVTQKLIAKGHRHILYIAGPQNVRNSELRLQGHLKAMRDAGLSEDPKYVHRTVGHIEDGYSAVNHDVNKSRNFTAICCFNDLLAIGVLKSLSENGFSVPTDIEVFGYDNLQISQFLQPSLSTVDVQKFSLGATAAEELMRHIEDPQLDYKSIELKTRLIFRESCPE